MERILIIDDSPTQANFLCNILTDSYDLTTAHTAEEGLQLARTGMFSLILLDVVMPGMDGFAILRTLQEDAVTRRTPVILITSLSDSDSEELGLTLGAVDYIRKPFRPPIVKARVGTHIKLYRYRLQAEREAMVDQLTGIANRRRYEDVHMTMWQDAVRLQVPISLCMLDIDKFKAYNDTFGHPAGDKVIFAVGQTAYSYLRRRTEFVARYGGEEFVILILGCDGAAAFDRVKKIRQAVEELGIPHNTDVAPCITVSAGGITILPKMTDSYDTYLKLADAMLYDAKRFGRNRVDWTNERRECLLQK